MATYGGPHDAVRLTSAEFDALFTQLRRATAQGPDDRRGALNNLTPGHVLAAVGELRSGRTVSLAAPIETVASRDNPEPCSHALTGDVGDRAVTPGLHFAMDRLAMNVHGNADSHIDALCHVIYDGALVQRGGPRNRHARRGNRAVDRRGPRRDRGTGGAARRPPGARRAVAGAGRPRDRRRPRGGRARATRPDPHRRSALRARRTSPTPRRARGVGRGAGSRRTASDHAAAARRTRDRRAGQRRQQRHRSQHHRRHRLPDPRPRHQRDGPASAGLPAVRGAGAAAARRRTAGRSCASSPPFDCRRRPVPRSTPSPSCDHEPTVSRRPPRSRIPVATVADPPPQQTHEPQRQHAHHDQHDDVEQQLEQ